MNLLTAIEQWVDTRAAKQVEIRMVDLARMVEVQVATQIEEMGLCDAGSRYDDLESRIDDMESDVESHGNGLHDLESSVDDLDTRIEEVIASAASENGDYISHAEVADLVRDVINNASISFNL